MAYCVVSIYSFRYLAKFWALFNPFHPGGSFPHFESEWGFSAFDSIKMRRVPRRKQKWYSFTFLMSWAEHEFNYQKVSACFGGSKASKICENFTMWILLYGVIDMMIQIKFWTPQLCQNYFFKTCTIRCKQAQSWSGNFFMMKSCKNRERFPVVIYLRLGRIWEALERITPRSACCCRGNQ